MLRTLIRFIDHLFAFDTDPLYAEAMRRHHDWSVWEQGYKAGVRNSTHGDRIPNPFGGRY